MSDDKLRAIYNARVVNDAPENRVNCPSPEQLQLLAENGKGGDAEALALLDHVFGCALCRAEFALLRTVNAASKTGEGSSPAETKAASRWFSPSRFAIAATLVIAAAIGSATLRRSGSTDTVRSTGADANDIVLVAPLPDVAGAQFIWRKMTGAVTYELQVLDTTGSVLAGEITSDTVFKPTPDQRARLESAGTIDWFVAAKRSDGNERRSSVARVRIVPERR